MKNSFQGTELTAVYYNQEMSRQFRAQVQTYLPSNFKVQLHLVKQEFSPEKKKKN